MHPSGLCVNKGKPESPFTAAKCLSTSLILNVAATSDYVYQVCIPDVGIGAGLGVLGTAEQATHRTHPALPQALISVGR